MKPKLMKTVYCYNFPEVRKIMQSVNLPEEIFKVTGKPHILRDYLYYVHGITMIIPETKDGYIDLDSLHIPIIREIKKEYTENFPFIKGLYGYDFNYFTSGSSEGIREILKDIQVRGYKTINILKGEYEGYKEYAKMYGLSVREVDFYDDLKHLRDGVWFISNPNAYCGNTIDDWHIKRILDAGHKVVFDLTYAGMTAGLGFDVSHKNIMAVIMSFSKNHGLFRYRMGFTFSRSPIPALYANKWFKDIERLVQVLVIAKKVDRLELFKKYKKIQNIIIKRIKDESGIYILPSDAFLLGWNPSHEPQEFKRVNHCRFCLTQYFEEWEKNNNE